MMQEDSNGESTFEFVDKRLEGMPSSDDQLTKTESLSSLSSSASLLTGGVVSPVSSGGNLLSTISPPSALPSFVSSAPVSQLVVAGVGPDALSSTSSLPKAREQPLPSTTSSTVPSAPYKSQTSQMYITPTFSPVIPLPGGPPLPDIASYAAGGQGDNIEAEHASKDHSSGLFGWVKGAMGSGILSKVAEKAKNSMDSMITTLDPQMKEFLYSGGDIDVVVASDKEVKVSPIREAFQAVFGRATITGLPAQSTMMAAQPVGFAAGVKAAEERIHVLRTSGTLHEHQPIVAIENFLVEIMEDKWYDVGALLLSDPARGINLQTFTQMTPVPAEVVAEAQDKTPSDYPLRWSGLAVTVGSIMAKNLQVHHTEWHQALTGVSRREMLLVAAKTLAGLYKNSIGGH